MNIQLRQEKIMIIGEVEVFFLRGVELFMNFIQIETLTTVHGGLIMKQNVL